MDTTQPAEFLPFFENLSAHLVSFPHCQTCGRFHWYPMKLCPHCQSAKIEWTAVAGLGTVYSWTVVRHAFSEEYADKVPYTVALVEFADAPGVRLVTNVLTQPGQTLSCGTEVEPIFPADESAPRSVQFAIV